MSTSLSTDSHTQVLNIRSSGRNVPNSVYMGRPGPWGNPFVIGRDGTRAEVIAKYRIWIDTEIAAGNVSDHQLLALRGKALLCWCHPEPCHCHVVVDKIEEAQLRRTR